MNAPRTAETAPHDPELQGLLDRMVSGGQASAAVALSGSPKRLEAVAAAGRTRVPDGRAVRPTDRFDLASLTKLFSATLALVLDETGLLPLSTPVGRIWGERVKSRLADLPLEALLRHRAGLRAWTPLYRRCTSRRAVLDLLLSDRALNDRRERYSDLDYLLWGLSVERAQGTSYERLLRRHVLRPLGVLGRGGARWAPGDRPDVVATRLGNEQERSLAAAQGVAVASRGGPPVGVVQDGNARFLKDPTAHAGLFGSALHLWNLAAEWLAPTRLPIAGSLERALAGGRSFTLGWRRRTVRGSGGPALSAVAFGHLGFTGGSVFVDPESDRIMILLAHRVSAANDLKSWRRSFHRHMQR